MIGVNLITKKRRKSMKKLILVTSPPASGKTFISKELAKALKHVVYLDKDTLISLSKQIFVVAGQEYDRSSDFFEENIRDYEYEAIVALALEALDYDDIVLINAPFTREIRDKKYIDSLKENLKQKDAKLVVIWVDTDVEVVKQRMIQRNSDRDTWKLDHWDEYIAGVNFDIPIEIDDKEVADDLIIFKNSSKEEFDSSMGSCLKILEQ
jgi:tRNA uridine 5-carbamoylmethylation protein Kti12